MSRTKQLVFAKHSYALKGDAPFSAQRLVNLYAEAGAGDDEYAPLLLRHCAGLTRVSKVDGPTRALKCIGDQLYAVAGGKLWSVALDGQPTELGAIPDAEVTTIAGGGDQVVVVAGSTAHVYDKLTDTVTEVTDVDLVNPGTVDYLDGFAIISELESGRFWVSALFDFTTWDGLDFATAESRSDKLVRVFVDHRELWLFGSKTTEIWYNSGNADFPFERSQSSSVERGLAAPMSVAKMDNTVFWLGEDLIAYRADGYTPIRVSTHALERELQAYAKKNDGMFGVSGFVYTEEGHKFYVLRFPDRPAWCFDVATGLWHERASGGFDRPWLASCLEHFAGKVFAGGAFTDGLYVLDREQYKDGFLQVPREAVSAPLHFSDRRFITDYAHIDMRCGWGDLGREPLAALAKSDDRGHTWSSERLRSMGAPGEFKTRVTWRGMGTSRERYFRVRIYDPIAVSIYAGHGRFTVGDS